VGFPRFDWPYVLTGELDGEISFAFAVYDDPDDPPLTTFNGGFAPTSSDLLTPEALAERLATEIGSAIEDVVSLEGITIDADGHWNIAFSGPDGMTVRMNMDDSVLEGTAALMGFRKQSLSEQYAQATDTGSTGLVTLTSQNQGTNIWIADIGPSVGTEPERDNIGTLSFTPRTSTAFRFGETEQREIAYELLAAFKVFKNQEGTEHLNEAIERLWEESPSLFRYSPNSSYPGVDPFTSDGVAHWYSLTEENFRKFRPVRRYPGLECYDMRVAVRQVDPP
jgi:hypothetical protein